MSPPQPPVKQGGTMDRPPWNAGSVNGANRTACQFSRTPCNSRPPGASRLVRRRDVTTASLQIADDAAIAMTSTTAPVGFAELTSATTRRSSARPCASPGTRPTPRTSCRPSSCASWPAADDAEAAPLPAAYFRRAAVNAAVDLLRRRTVHAESVYDDQAPHAAVPPPSLLKEQLRRAIATLDSDDATLFLLRHVEGLSNRRAGRDVPAGEEQRSRPAPPDPAPAAGRNGALGAARTVALG